jgi:hypothetical protein
MFDSVLSLDSLYGVNSTKLQKLYDAREALNDYVIQFIKKFDEDVLEHFLSKVPRRILYDFLLMYCSHETVNDFLTHLPQLYHGILTERWTMLDILHGLDDEVEQHMHEYYVLKHADEEYSKVDPFDELYDTSKYGSMKESVDDENMKRNLASTQLFTTEKQLN